MYHWERSNIMTKPSIDEMAEIIKEKKKNYMK